MRKIVNDPPVVIGGKIVITLLESDATLYLLLLSFLLLFLR
jgi:hypothetical protein